MGRTDRLVKPQNREPHRCSLIRRVLTRWKMGHIWICRLFCTHVGGVESSTRLEKRILSANKGAFNCVAFLCSSLRSMTFCSSCFRSCPMTPRSRCFPPSVLSCCDCPCSKDHTFTRSSRARLGFPSVLLHTAACYLAWIIPGRIESLLRSLA
ncbi:hypothetical protein BDV98DRAFT_376374 [Pterulicium gracile]|uniref:Uncharacterized protein n=1 Tax=Pterulicium gracile TaxID=1884261 RepID=A0A5C3Q0K4_9AGAR|nr:hypothetical protein BDV98DRAFT_376374 [Pterula gracilis]